ERTDRRGHREKRETYHQDAFASVAVAQYTPREQQGGERQDVGVNSPDETALTCTEVGLNRGQGNVEHGVVEHDNEQPDDQYTENRPTSRMTIMETRRLPETALCRCVRIVVLVALSALPGGIGD